MARPVVTTLAGGDADSLSVSTAGRSPDTSLTARKSSEDLQSTRLDWCSGVCPDHLFGRTHANQELLRSLSPKWGSVESLCFEPPGACLGRPFSAFSFSAGPRERQKLAETRNWRLLRVVQWHSKSLVWAQKGKASIAEQLTRVRQSWQECFVQPLHSARQ